MEDIIFFSKIDQPFGCFSNFSRHPVTLDCTTWMTAEHYFQASKFIDHEKILAIEMAKSPVVAAQMGRDGSSPLRPDWEDVKDKVMRKVIKAKVLQHSDVRELLLSTGNAMIIEHTPRDSYWGDGPDGAGKNMLGKIYMEARAELTQSSNLEE